MNDLTPKQWQKKYCHKDYVICDGMTEAMSIWDIVNYIVVVGIFASLYYILKSLYIRYIKEQKENEK